MKDTYLHHERKEKQALLPLMVKAIYPYALYTGAASINNNFAATSLLPETVKTRGSWIDASEREAGDIYFDHAEETGAVDHYRMNAVAADVYHRMPVFGVPGLPKDLYQTLMAAANDVKSHLHVNLQEFAVMQYEQHRGTSTEADPLQSTFLGSAVEGVISVEQALAVFWASSPEFMSRVDSLDSLLKLTVATVTGRRGYISQFARTLPFSSLVSTVNRGSIPAAATVMVEENGIEYYTINSDELSKHSRQDSVSYWRKHVPCPAVYSLAAADTAAVAAQLRQMPAADKTAPLLHNYREITPMDWTLLALCKQMAIRENNLQLAEEIQTEFFTRMQLLQHNGFCGWDYSQF